MTPGRKRGYREEPRRPPGYDRIATPIPAPGNLALLQAFLNTGHSKTGADELATPRDLADWLTRQGLLPAGTRLGDEDLERARHARHGLRAVLWVNSGGEVDSAVFTRLDRAAVGARAQVRFDGDGASRFELVSRDFDDALGTLLGIAHAGRCADNWPWFKLCAHPDCYRAFFDFTKNRTGRYCTRRCGDRARAKAFRRAQKAKGY